MNKLNKIIQCPNVIEDTVSKLDTEVVWENGVDFTNMSSSDIKSMKIAFEKMQKDNDKFSFRYIPKELRKYITKLYNENWIDNELDYTSLINDKDILILDDTVTTGSTISHFVQTINDMYTPKSITVITLFSPLEK